MLMQRNECALMLIDMQVKLCPLVKHHRETMNDCEWVLKVAKECEVPILTTEQYPKALGHTVTQLREHIEDKHIVEKVSFSALGNPDIATQIHEMHRKQWVLIGIETHVCVMQTAMNLQENGHQVFVVEDATSSRSLDDKRLALARMQQCGIHIVSREMVMYEWLSQAGTALFKKLNEAFVKS